MRSTRSMQPWLMAALVLLALSACVTDVLVADIVNPFYPERKLRDRIRRFCGTSMAAACLAKYFAIKSRAMGAAAVAP